MPKPMLARTTLNISRNLAVAPRHMVAAKHPWAADAALDVLERGGNAVDAAVTVPGTGRSRRTPSSVSLAEQRAVTDGRRWRGIRRLCFDARGERVQTAGKYPSPASGCRGACARRERVMLTLTKQLLPPHAVDLHQHV
jgi:hypothetical protein